MPGTVVHCWLALDTLDHWERAGDVPFSANGEECRQGFLNGCMGPDMGLFPGSEPFATDLAHHIDSGELARNLVRSAQTDVQKAYAWGWFSHILADVILHPVINRGAGSWRHGDSSKAIPPGDDERAHRVVEMGLDAFWCHQHARDRRLDFRPVFDERNIEFLVLTFEATYGFRFSARALLASHKACARYNRMLYLLGRIHGARLSEESVPLDCMHHYVFHYLPARIASGMFRRDSVTYDLTHSIRPEPWLLEEVSDKLQHYFPRFHDGFRSRLEGFPNYDLHLGETYADVYEPAIKARVQLSKRLQTV
jgi:hypothetical protein